MSETSPATVSGWQAHWPAAVLALVAALIAVWARHRLFPALSWNRDEPVYLWHVDVLRSGHLTATDGGHPALFHPWLSARGDGLFFTQYTLGWPLVLLASAVLTGSAATALPLGAALAVLGTYAVGVELLDRRVALGGAALLTVSPILPIQGGAHLSYLFTLGLGLLFGTLLLRGIRLGRPGELLAAGALLGWIFLTRPYDAVLWGSAFLAYAVLRERARWTATVRPLVVCGLGALPFVVAALVYNRHVTGQLLQFPITAADPLDSFGFGPKRLMPTFEVVDYGVDEALRASAKNAAVLPWFLAGSYLGLLVAVAGAWQRRRDRSILALLLIGAAFPVGYFVFWGTHLSSLASRISGPIYFVPLYAPVCLLMASALAHWWERRRAVAVAVLVALVVVTVPVSINRFAANRDISVRQEAWRTSVENLEGPALVFVADTSSYLLYTNPFSANAPNLDGRLLYAVEGSPEMLDLIAERPDRPAYLQQGTVASQEIGPREDPYDLDVVLTPIEVRRGRTVDLAVGLRPPAGTPHAHVEIRTGAVTVTEAVPPGGTATERTLHPPSVAAGGLPLLERGTIVVTVGFGETPAAAERSPRVRQSLVYRVVDGTVEVLLPAAEQRRERVADRHEWRRTIRLDELRVDVTAT